LVTIIAYGFLKYVLKRVIKVKYSLIKLLLIKLLSIKLLSIKLLSIKLLLIKLLSIKLLSPKLLLSKLLLIWKLFRGKQHLQVCTRHIYWRNFNSYNLSIFAKKVYLNNPELKPIFSLLHSAVMDARELNRVAQEMVIITDYFPETYFSIHYFQKHKFSFIIFRNIFFFDYLQKKMFQLLIYSQKYSDFNGCHKQIPNLILKNSNILVLNIKRKYSYFVSEKYYNNDYFLNIFYL